MRPVSVAFFYSSSFLCFFFASDAEIGFALSLAPSPLTPPHACQCQRSEMGSILSPLRPPPPPFLPAVFLVSTVLRLSARPRLFSSFCRDVLSTCLSVRLSVSVPCPRLCVPYNSVLLALFIIPFLFSISSYRVYLYQMQRFSA